MFSPHQCRNCIESIHVAGDLETVYMQIKNHLDCMSTLCVQGNMKVKISVILNFCERVMGCSHALTFF